MSEDLGVMRAISYQVLTPNIKLMGIKKGSKFKLKFEGEFVNFICTEVAKVDELNSKITAEREFIV